MKRKLWYAPYELQALEPLNRHQVRVRRGFLVKIQTRHVEQGFADCHPLAEFGDGSVEDYLQELKRGKVTSPLLKKTLRLALYDGRAREEKRRLISPALLKSHYTCTHVHVLTTALIQKKLREGFTTIKVKVGRHPQQEAAYLNRLPWDLFSLLRWRFDANSQGGDVFLRHLLPKYRECVDFIEDPIPFKKKEWSLLNQQYSVPCAFDHPQGATSYSQFSGLRVVKPVRDVVRIRSRDIITNCMDHPVGQSFAVWIAQHAVSRWSSQKTDYGLLTQHLFKKNEFFDQIQTQGVYFKSSSDGYGVGFTRALKRIKWKDL